jgi:hypothetical protein
METNRSIRACILPGMLTTKLDLSDAYFHIDEKEFLNQIPSEKNRPDKNEFESTEYAGEL